MPILYIREFSALAEDKEGNVIPAAQEPGVDRTLNFSVSEVNLTLGQTTKFIELSCDASCHYTLDGTATVSNMRLESGAGVFKGVKGGETISVLAAI